MKNKNHVFSVPKIKSLYHIVIQKSFQELRCTVKILTIFEKDTSHKTEEGEDTVEKQEKKTKRKPLLYMLQKISFATPHWERCDKHLIKSSKHFTTILVKQCTLLKRERMLPWLLSKNKTFMSHSRHSFHKYTLLNNSHDSTVASCLSHSRQYN